MRSGEYLRKFGHGTRFDLEDLLLKKLPDVLQPQQKVNKVKNLLQAMRRAQLIELRGTRPHLAWYLVNATDKSQT